MHPGMMAAQAATASGIDGFCLVNKANYLIYLHSDDNQIEIGALSMH